MLSILKSGHYETFDDAILADWGLIETTPDGVYGRPLAIIRNGILMVDHLYLKESPCPS